MLWVRQRGFGQCAARVGVAVLFCACSAYDSDLLRQHTDGQQASAGTGGTAGSAPMDAGPASDADPGDVTAVTCGDGEVGLDEKCDVAIPAGMPGACPTACPPLVDCVPRMLNGSNCQAECLVLEQLCANDDGCCPGRCNAESDADCSQRCGDGIVQEADGETCEPDSDAGGAGCPTEDDCHDDDPCTTDLFTGSEANCNAACSFPRIAMTAAGDGCCPDGANANLDGDCKPVCGNNVRETGEECDGSLGCDGCELTLTSQQIACLQMVEETGNDCDRCACMQCAPQQLACRDSGNATRDMHCTAITECANENDCVGGWCYCTRGDFLCNDGTGPCKEVIDDAAASDPSGATVTMQRADPNTAIGRAAASGECNVVNCADVCP
jgi:hypothetical protein